MTRAVGPTASTPGKSISPTEVARVLEPGPDDAWHQKLSAVRRAAIRLAEGGAIEILRKGKPVDPATARGVIRLRARAADAEA